MTATGYALDGPDIESRWGRGFPCSPDWPRSPLSLLYNWYRGFPWIKRPDRGADHPPPSVGFRIGWSYTTLPL